MNYIYEMNGRWNQKKVFLCLTSIAFAGVNHGYQYSNILQKVSNILQKV